MSCSVAVSSSPAFSPSRVPSSMCCKTSALSSSPDAVNSSPSSPLRLRLQRPLTNLRPSKDGGPCSSSSAGASTSPILKRKRPPRLDIPIAPPGFTGPAAAEGRGEEAVEVEGDGYSAYCKRGRREAMEDRYSAVVDLQGDPKQAFFGVFDGHGGAEAAEFAALNMDKNIMDEVLRRANEETEEAIRRGYLHTDSQFLQKGDARGGSCCVTALVRNGSLVVSNVGDCRAVISRGGVAEPLTSDHRPSREDEKDRIEALGGYVDCCRGVWRIQGTLAVSRGIGDRDLKPWVTAEPETRILSIEPEHEFLILASDGLWDKVDNQEAVDVVRSSRIDDGKLQPLSACKRLVELSVSRGTVDDTSVLLIQLGHYVQHRRREGI